MLYQAVKPHRMDRGSQRHYKLSYLILFIYFCLSIHYGSLRAISMDEVKSDSINPGRYVHNLGVDLRSAYVIPMLPFFKGDNFQQKPIREAFSGHLKYAFKLPEGTLGSQVYSDTYQGLGVSYFNFGNKTELGNPIAVYLFQHSRIVRFSSLISLDYEWNFGLSNNWRPYDYEYNPHNTVIGSKVNAYLNTGLYLKWSLAKGIKMTTGVDVTHFSNGNTGFPNAGLNMVGIKGGVLYDFVKSDVDKPKYKATGQNTQYPCHISYDLVMFGSWRRKGVVFLDEAVASPDRYPVLGAYFAPMYNFGYRFRAGASLDALYDGSANVYTEDYIMGTEQEFFTPPIDQQLALGISARAEYVMPIFTIALGLGTNVLHRGGDLSGTYQTFALKINATRNSFLHIGYNLKDFKEPNFLMLGLGFRFNNHTPSLVR